VREDHFLRTPLHAIPFCPVKADFFREGVTRACAILSVTTSAEYRLRVGRQAYEDVTFIQ
jgi:hypothetical protein